MSVTLHEPVSFTQIKPESPSPESIQREFSLLEQAFQEAVTPQDQLQVIAQWEDLRRSLDTWSALIWLRFDQDTQNESYQKARDYCDELIPKITDWTVRIKKQLLISPHRPQLEAALGAQVFALWESDILTFDPVIEADLIQESKLKAEYTALLAAAALNFRGETLNLSGIRRFCEDADRATRHDAEQVRWEFFAAHQADLDRIYGDLVQVRQGMAQKLGYENYIPLGYKRMRRVDYTQQDVERYRDQVRQEVVPLAQKILARQAERLGVDRLMAWDEAVFDLRGNPKPQGDHDWMLIQAQRMFDSMDPELSSFFRLLVDKQLLDLKNRPGKAGGGFCTSFPSYGLPFVFANFNGTKGDVEVFTHEMGHAFQGWQSRHGSVSEYLWPTLESCEIHSMSLEFLTWPYMDYFFGPEEAQRFREIHLAESLLFLPYGVAVDHFQHLVYANPTASAQERHDMWQTMEALYLPWRDYGDLTHPAMGGRWQAQGHIYGEPFYYIDYTLAGCCALQFWVRAEQDFAGALQDYVKLCRLGGSAPFQELVRTAGLVSPFSPGALADVVQQAQRVLKL